MNFSKQLEKSRTSESCPIISLDDQTTIKAFNNKSLFRIKSKVLGRALIGKIKHLI